MIQLITAAVLLAVNPGENTGISSSYEVRHVDAVADRTVDNTTDQAVEKMARAFRIQVYSLYGDRRSKYDQRFETGRKLLKQFANSERNEQQQQLVTQWFQDAMLDQSYGNDAPLPELGVKIDEPNHLTIVGEDQTALVDREAQSEEITEKIEYHRTMWPSSRHPLQILESMERAEMSAMELEAINSTSSRDTNAEPVTFEPATDNPAPIDDATSESVEWDAADLFND